MKVVMIEWYDASSGTGWDSRGFEECSEKVVSVGIVKGEDKEKIELEVIPNINIAHKLHQIAIPQGAIKRIRELKIK